LLSVSNPQQAGITVGTPLTDMEDRGHLHTYNTTLTLNEKDIAADSCCNKAAACNGQIPIPGQTDNGTSGMPFTQLLLCQIMEETAEDVPIGTVAYFSGVQQCPNNWIGAAATSGYFMIPWLAAGVYPGPDVPLTVGQQPMHSHAFHTKIKTWDVGFIGVEGCCNDSPADSGVCQIIGETAAMPSNIPYLSLLTCMNQSPTFNGTFPKGALLFNEIGCFGTWNATTDIGGRFLVALPEDSIPGAKFGAVSINQTTSKDPTHWHFFGGKFETQTCEIGLVRAPIDRGYAGSDTYKYLGITEGSSASYPWLGMNLCEQVSMIAPETKMGQ